MLESAADQHNPNSPEQPDLVPHAASSEALHKPQSVNQNTMDQMIEDTISKVTAQNPLSNFPPPQLSISTFQTPQFTFSAPLGYPNHFGGNVPSQSLSHTLPPPHVRSAPSHQLGPSANAGTRKLPQDILHILESDFTSGASDSHGGKDKEISRVAEELRVQVRLSRYRRGRDLLVDSEDENSPDGGDESEGSDSESSNNEQSGADDKGDVDDVDGSGDEDAERVKNNHALAKLKEEIEQIIGIPEHPSASESNHAVPRIEEEESQDEVGCQPKCKTLDTAPKSHPDPAETSGLAGEDIKLASKKATNSKPSTSSQVKKARGKSSAKADVDDSGEETDDAAEECDTYAGPKTANELKEPPPEVIEVPFTRISEAEMRTISPFGVITSLIGNVLVIRGTRGLGYDRVLDEGTLTCCNNGLVIGKIFETFGSVTNPHYSIRLPSHVLASAGKSDEGFDLSPGVELYYLPTHSKFVFTSELRAQPKGTDASNLFDEEVDHGEEIEFSDDEAEAAYLKACKLAKKASASARQSRSNQPQDHRRGSNNSDSVHFTEDGRRMFVKPRGGKFNHADKEGGGNSHYNVLERPKGNNLNNNSGSTSTSNNPTNQQTSNPRSTKAKKRSGARGRKQNKGPSQQQNYNSSDQHTNNHSSNQHANDSSASFEPITQQSNSDASGTTTGPQFQSNQQTNTAFSSLQNLSLAPNLTSNTSQAGANTTAMMIAQGQNEPRPLADIPPPVQFNQNMNPSTFWNGSSSLVDNNSMLNAMTIMNNLQTGIPCYNPMMPSLNPIFSPMNYGLAQAGGFPSYNPLVNFPTTGNLVASNHIPSNQSSNQDHSLPINDNNNINHETNNSNPTNQSFNFNQSYPHFNNPQFFRPP